MFHSAFWAFFLVLGSDTVCAVDLNITPDLAPVPTAHMTNATTVPPPAPTTTTTTVPPPAPTTTTVPPPAPTTTTVPPPAPTTTTVPPPAPTTEVTNITTVPPPAPTTEGTNVTTAPPPAPTTEGTNVTTAPPPAPTTEGTNVTTALPPAPTTEGTNVTTAPPPAPTTEGTNVTTAPPPAPTTPTAAPTPMPQPAVGSYNVRSDPNSPACLMATMGLQISYKEGAVLKSVNLDPNSTAATGKCGANGSDASLALTSDESSILFSFSEEGGKFRLHAVNVTLRQGATGIIFSAANTNLSLWEASVGSSYMCRKDQNYNITDVLTLHTLGLQVQPFGVKNSSYATAHECAMDDTSILIPIVVGAALAGLILIVMIAYVIGRRKTYVGYQTL